MSGQVNGLSEPVSRRLTLFVTNGIKVCGAILAVHEGLGAHPNAVVLGIYTFMMTRAQATEEQVVRLVGRIFGAGHEEPPTRKPPARRR